MQDRYPENYKTSLEEIKEDLSKWKGISYSWIERVKIIILPKLIYRVTAIAIKIPSACFFCTN